MNTKPTLYVSAGDAGVSFTDHTPEPQRDYTRRHVQIAVHRDLTLEIHGELFSTKTKLNADDALGLIAMLSYALREQLCRTKTEFVEVTK